MDNRIFGLDPQLLIDTGVTLIAMLVLFILLTYLLFNPARNLIKKREEYIKSQLDEAAASKTEAMDMKSEYDAKLARVEEESGEILAQARQKALKKEKEILNEANEEAHKIKERARGEVELEKEKVKDDVKQQIVAVASVMAGKFVEDSMDEKRQAELIDETLKEMGDDTWQN